MNIQLLKSIALTLLVRKNQSKLKNLLNLKTSHSKLYWILRTETMKEADFKSLYFFSALLKLFTKNN